MFLDLPKINKIVCHQCRREYDVELLDCPFCAEFAKLLNKDYTLGRCIK